MSHISALTSHLTNSALYAVGAEPSHHPATAKLNCLFLSDCNIQQ